MAWSQKDVANLMSCNAWQWGAIPDLVIPHHYYICAGRHVVALPDRLEYQQRHGEGVRADGQTRGDSTLSGKNAVGSRSSPDPPWCAWEGDRWEEVLMARLRLLLVLSSLSIVASSPAA